jgi:hypothetical protein
MTTTTQSQPQARPKPAQPYGYLRISRNAWQAIKVGAAQRGTDIIAEVDRLIAHDQASRRTQEGA